MKELLKIKNIEDIVKASKIIKRVVKDELKKFETAFDTQISLLYDYVEVDFKNMMWMEETDFSLQVEFDVKFDGIETLDDYARFDRKHNRDFSFDFVSNIIESLEEYVDGKFTAGGTSAKEDGTVSIDFNLKLSESLQNYML